MSSKRESLKALTGIRFVAACHVVLYHYAPRVSGYEQSVPAWVRSVINAGPVSVGLFFVLSGFILAYNYAGEGGKMKGSRGEFWRARFARIYPVYLLAFVAFTPFAILKALGQQQTAGARAATLAGEGLFALTLTQSWTPGAVYWNAPAWSLSVEAFFYLLFPALLAPMMSISPRRLAWALAGVWLPAIAAPLIHASMSARGTSDEAFWNSWLTYNPLLWLPAFLFGIAAARLFLSGGRWLTRPGWVLAGCGLTVIATLSVCEPMWQPVLYNMLLMPLFTLSIYSLALGGGWFGAFLSRPALQVLGEASYGLYMIHVPLWNYIIPVLTFLAASPKPLSFRAMLHRDAAAHVGHWALFAMYLIGAVILSVVCLYCLEEPARKAIRAWHKRRTPQGEHNLVLPEAYGVTNG